MLRWEPLQQQCILQRWPSVSAYSSRFGDGPVLQYKFTSNAVANYKDGGGSGDGSFDVTHGVSIANGYFTGSPTTQIIVVSTDASGKQLCPGGETVAYDNPLSPPTSMTLTILFFTLLCHRMDFILNAV